MNTDSVSITLRPDFKAKIQYISTNYQIDESTLIDIFRDYGRDYERISDTQVTTYLEHDHGIQLDKQNSRGLSAICQFLAANS